MATDSKYDHDSDKLVIASSDNLAVVSTEDLEEPTPSETPPKEVHFASGPKFADNGSNITPNNTQNASNKVHPISISAPTSNSIGSNPNDQLTPNENDVRLREILQTHGMMTTHSQTVRSLQYLHSLRVKDNLYPNYNTNNNQNNMYFPQSSPIILSPATKSQFMSTTHNDAMSTAATHFDDLEEAESKMNDSISDWTLTFTSPIREKQFRVYVTERYGTSIRVAILSMIIAYIFLASVNGSFVKDTIRVTFVCIGLFVMLITFTLASSFSRASSSSTVSYLKSLFQSDDANTTNGLAKDGEKTTNIDNKEDIADNNKDIHNKNEHVQNMYDNTNQHNGSTFSSLSAHAYNLFGLYSSYMMALCVISLLLLLILQNTVPSEHYLSDDKFLVYYILASLVTSTYGSIGYKTYLICAWSLYLLWNILAYTVQNATKSGQSFDFLGINIALIIGNLILGHQVKGKEMARRKSFLRAMNYVHYWSQSRTDSAMNSKNQQRIITPNQAFTTPTNKQPTTRRLVSMYDNNSRGFDITSMPSVRDKLSLAVLGELVDKSLADKSKTGSDSPNKHKIATSGSIYSQIQMTSPRKRRYHHDKKQSKLYNEIRREITKRGGNDVLAQNGGAVSELGAKLGLTNKRESNAMGLLNVIRGFGGNLAHLDTHHEERDDTISDLLEQSRRLSTDYEFSKSNKNLKNRVGGGNNDENEEEKEEKYQNNNASILTTVQSGKNFDDNEDDENNNNKVEMNNHFNNMHMLLRNTITSEAHCGSIHELPKWYSYSAEAYILCGYRINYDVKGCCKSMFEGHNETMNIWTEFLPCLILIILVAYFNVNETHFWANSDVHDSFTKTMLYVSMPFVIVRPIISGLAHTFSCVSKKSAKIWWRLDFLSIIVAAGFGSIIWTHCVFFCEPNIQILYMFACFTLSFSTTITALTTKNMMIRDVSLGAFFVFTLIFLYLYEVYLLLLSNKQRNMSYGTVIYWTISVLCTFSAVLFRASKYPEAFFVKRRFKKLMKRTFEEKFSIESGGEVIDHKTTDTLTDKERISSIKQQVSFARMLEDIQSFTLQTENKLAKIEKLDNHLYDDMDNKELERRRKELVEEIENLENEIVQEIKHEIQIEECMEEAYINLISDNQKQWFNYLFTSHNFWHIFMNLAVMFSVVAWREYFKWRALEENITCPH